MKYSEGLKKRMVSRLLGAGAVSATSLSREVGIPQNTLSRWLREAGSIESISNKKPSKKDRSQAKKIKKLEKELVRKEKALAEVAALHFADKVRKLRCLGAAAYDLANVAAGRVSGFFEKGLRTWDIAAGAILVHEAGGLLHAEEFAPTRWRILASAPGIEAAMQAVLDGSG